MKKIAKVNFHIGEAWDEDEMIPLFSDVSLSDYDIALFSPNLLNTRFFEWLKKEEGTLTCNLDKSKKVKDSFEHWRSEIERFTLSGKNVFVFLPARMEFNLSNVKDTWHITETVPSSNYAFLPEIDNRIVNATGNIMRPVSPIVKDFYKDVQDHMRYHIYFDDEISPETALFETKAKDKLLGFIKRYNNACFVCLPVLNIDYDLLSEPIDGNDDEFDYTKARAFGQRFLQHIIKIDKAIKGNTEKTPPPEWIKRDTFSLKESGVIQAKIADKKESIKLLEEEVESLEIDLQEGNSLKGLLFEQGKPLEDAVTKALHILGYEAENYDNGELELDQVITSPEGYRYIGECEGKDSKHIDIGKFRQLTDAMREDFEREEIEEKAFGILLGNPQRLISPDSRTVDFTTKCINGANREGIALVKTADLFIVAKYVEESGNVDFAKTCRDKIHADLGKVVVFPVVPG